MTEEAKGAEGNDLMTLSHGSKKKCRGGQITLSSLMGYLTPCGKVQGPLVACPRQQMAAWAGLCKGGCLHLGCLRSQLETTKYRQFYLGRARNIGSEVGK